MTNEEMAAELRKAGWRVEEPLTQANCKHPNMRGGGGMSCDGSGYQESYCMACGYRSRSEWGPRAESPFPSLRTDHTFTVPEGAFGSPEATEQPVRAALKGVDDPVARRRQVGTQCPDDKIVSRNSRRIIPAPRSAASWPIPIGTRSFPACGPTPRFRGV